MLHDHPVIARFPERQAELRRLYARSEDFRSLCTDFADAVDALNYWQQKGEPERARTGEYRQFVEDLEAEIGEALRQANST